MAKIGLLAKLDALSMLIFGFTDVTKTKDRDGNAIAILQLAEPIPLVRGSQEVEYNGTRHPVTAKDVKEIKIHENDFNENFSFDTETNTGEYKGSELILDVSKNGQVWLRKTSFAQSGSEFRNTATQVRLGKMLGLGPVDKAAPTPSAAKIEPVATGAKK